MFLVAQVLYPWILKNIPALAVVVLIQHCINGHNRLAFSTLGEFCSHEPLFSRSASTTLETFKSRGVFSEGCVIYVVLWDGFEVTWQVSLLSTRKLFKQVILS